MELTTGAMSSLLPKLGELLLEEYDLQKGLKKGIKYLRDQLLIIEAALVKVSDMPLDHLDLLVKFWADDVREMSYAIEDDLDSFLVRVEGLEPEKPHTFLSFIEKACKQAQKCNREIRKITSNIKYVKIQVKRYDRYTDVIGNTVAKTEVDPRLLSTYNEISDLVGIDKAMEELMELLSDHRDVSENKLKTMSIVGFGGLEKTSLAKAVYDELHKKFDCAGFISVGQNPDIKNVLKDILLTFGVNMYNSASTMNARQLIDELRKFLANKRYLIVIDDIWDTQTWEAIKYALVDDDNGSRIITTTHIGKVATRIGKLAEKDGVVYNMQPTLSDDNSSKLFYTRICGGKSKSFDVQSDEVSEKILRKCGGVPLAIITIASLLVGKRPEDWSKVYDHIGFGHEDNEVVNNTRKILFYSFYDLPSCLKTCLLHLSMFVEDAFIWKSQLIWIWIAEGFVPSEQGLNLFEVGESYFNLLVNRGMIQFVESVHGKAFDGCRVHDMVLDLIRNLSSELNFVTIHDREQEKSTCSPSRSKSIRRLAVHKRSSEHGCVSLDMGRVRSDMGHVRSFNATLCTDRRLLQLLNFKVLRVLLLEDCDFAEEGCRLEHLGKLVQLRYLGLFGTRLAVLPTNIGHDLKYLQTLDVRGSGIEELPPSVGELSKLMCLLATKGTRMMGGIGKLTSLEQLELWSVDKCPNFVTELGKLTKLTVLDISFDEMEKSAFKALTESLRSMHKIQTLWIRFEREESVFVDSWEDWAPPSNFRDLCLLSIRFSRLPSWINFSCVPHLSLLDIEVQAMEKRDLQNLGRLPSLRTLLLASPFLDCLPYTVGIDEFQSLRRFHVHVEILCGGEGVLPMLQELECRATVGKAIGLVPGNMQSIQKVIYRLDCTDCSCQQVKEAEAEMRLVAQTHPNRPTLHIKREHYYESDDNDVSKEVFSGDGAEYDEDEEGGSKEGVLGNDHEEGTNSIMKSAQDPMVNYLTGSMNSLFDKLTKPKNRANFEALHEDLMTLNKDFFDKLVGNGRRVVNLQVKVWMKQVRELVFDIEDWIDGMPETVMGDPTAREEKIEEFRTLIKEACRRCERYDLIVKAGADVAGFALAPSKVVTVYSPLLLGDKACDPVGLDGPKEMLKEHLLDEHKKMKVVSILGKGGLGKTTLAKELHGELQAEFSCGAFIYIGMNPSVWRILVNILYQTMSSSDRMFYFKSPPQHKYVDFLPQPEREQEVILKKQLDEQQVIALLWGHLSKKRYFIVLDGIWSIRYWRVINGALPDNNLGSRILTTTRIADVAESCSPGPTDVVHHMKTLSEVESKRLFLGEEETLVDDEILKICGGIPLAITLAARARKFEELVEPKMLGKSLLSSLNQYSTSEGMTNVLHMIYADLSIPLRSCFLYLGVFPENYTYKKDHLILLWAAEEFIPIIYEECLWVIGERYFNELMSRGLIQPVFNFDDDQAVGCTIHSVILDFIRSMSREENFATELTSGPFPCDTIRRFLLDYGSEDEADTLSPSSVHLSSMRSLIVFGVLQGVSKGEEEVCDNTPPSVSRDNEGVFDDLSVCGDDDGVSDDPSFSEDDDPPVPRVSTINLPTFKLLRVLDLEDTKNLKNHHLEGIGGLVLLRYLGLGGTDINELPEDIGELQQLETLVLRRKGLITFPSSIVKLQKVRHLLLPVDTKQIWEMPELEVASGILAENSSSLGKMVELLRKSEQLRMLGVSLEISNPKAADIVSFLEAVVKSKLQSISLDFQWFVPLLVDSWEKVTALLEKKFEPPRFELRISVCLLPNMGSLASLTHLHIELDEAKAEDFIVLSDLTNLVLLNLTVGVCSARERFIIKKGMFPCVKMFSFKTARSWTGLEFKEGAIQQLQRIGRSLGASVRGNQEYLDIGIEHLTCLARVRATINCYGATVSEVEAAEAAIRTKLSKIATKPTLELNREDIFSLQLMEKPIRKYDGKGGPFPAYP